MLMMMRMMLVDFGSLVARGPWCWATAAKAEKEKMASNIFGADSNVTLAENPFININRRCMSAILDPERATECSWYREHDAKYTEHNYTGRWYMAQWEMVHGIMQLTQENAAISTLHCIAKSTACNYFHSIATAN